MVGWTNIAGWLVVVTVQGYFGGRCIDVNSLVAVNMTDLGHSSILLCGCSRCVEWDVRNHRSKDIWNLLGNSHLHNSCEHLGK